MIHFARFGFLALVFTLAQACAVFQAATPAERAAQALEAESYTHEAATQACAAYESALVARAIKPDAKVSGRCAALRNP